MLDNILNLYKQEADQILGDWQSIDKNILADAYYVYRGTPRLGSAYAAALMCKYWYKIGLIWRNNSNAMTQEDCYQIVWDGIEVAIKYAPWRNPESNLYNDPTGPDKTINRCIESRRVDYYNFSNKDKRKLNHHANTDSLDNLTDSNGDYALNLIENFESVYQNKEERELYLKFLVKDLISKDFIYEALIVDLICYTDCVLYKDETNMYSQRKLISNIHELDSSYIKEFSTFYDVDENFVKEYFNNILNLSNFKLNKLINRALYLIKTNSEYLNYIK